MTTLSKTVIILISFSLFSVSCTEVEMRQVSQQMLASLAAPASTPLTLKEMDLGLRDALRVGSERVVTQVGIENGYNNDLHIHIPLPEALVKADKFA